MNTARMVMGLAIGCTGLFVIVHTIWKSERLDAEEMFARFILALLMLCGSALLL